MVMANIAAGMSVKRPGQEQYSSDGFHLSIEMESEIADANHFRSAVAALFAEVKGALEAEIANGSARDAEPAAVDLWAAGDNGGNGRGSDGGQGKGSEPATKAQLRYVISLLARSGARTKPEMTSRLSEVLGVQVEDVNGLDRKAASRVIEELKG